MKFTQLLKEGLVKKMNEDVESDDNFNGDPLDDEQQETPRVRRKKMKTVPEPVPEPEPEPEPVIEDTTPKFEVGDVLVMTDTKQSKKIPEDAWEYLLTYKTYTVLKVSETGKLDLGCHISRNTPEGGVEKIYMYSPKRFSLKDDKK